MIDITNENEITKLSQLENDVGFVNQLQINGVELTGNKTSEDLALLSSDASNLTNIGQKVFDGQWVPIALNPTFAPRLTDGYITYPKSEHIEYDLSEYLPNDEYNYEIMIAGVTKTTTEALNKSARIELFTTIFPLSAIFADNASVSTAISQCASGTVILPIGTDRKLIVRALSFVDCTFSLWLRGYRRIGTNQ